MSNLHTEHFEETKRETQDERAAQAERMGHTIRLLFPVTRQERFTIHGYTHGQYPTKRAKAALETTLEDGLLDFREDLIDRISESILKCPSPTTDADLRTLKCYIREFTSSVEEALTPLEDSDWEELGRAAHEIFVEIEEYYLERHVELEGLDDAERDALILSKFGDAYDKFLHACDEWTTLTVAEAQLDKAKGKLLRQIDMIYFLK